MFIVKVLHHPDVLIPKNAVTFDLSDYEKVHLTFHKTFVQGLYEYFGDPEYDVTPYNQRSFVVFSIPAKAINPKIAVELIRRANELNHGDELTNVLFDDSGSVMAMLEINVAMFTFDSLDPRNPEHWSEIAKNVTSIYLTVGDKTYNALSLYLLKKYVSGDPIVRAVEEWFSKAEIQELLKETEEARKYLDILSDDLTTFLLRELTKIEDELDVVDFLSEHVLFPF